MDNELKETDKKEVKQQLKILEGFQDFLPEKMLLRNRIINTIKTYCEVFGFLPQETPCLEYAELLLGKYGEEEKLIYEFRDKGDRHVALRYDLTVPMGRITQTYGNSLVLPYRRYQMGMVWRADKPGKGRYREFMQIDADIIGDDSQLADIEIILLMINIMQGLKLKTTVRINCRAILDALVDVCKLNNEEGIKLLRVIDKFDKIGLFGVKEELKELFFTPEVVREVEKYLSIKGDFKEILISLEDQLKSSPELFKGTKRLSGVFTELIKLGVSPESVKIDPTIARGLNYYTGLIYETTLNELPGFGSICSGGRYDRLLKLPSGDFVPTIGTSIGLDRLFAAIEELNKTLPKIKTTTKVFIANFGEEMISEYLKIANELRAKGISVEIFPQSLKIAKQFKLADRKGIPKVLLIGSDELANCKVTVKDMESGTQETVDREQIVDYLEKSLRQST